MYKKIISLLINGMLLLSFISYETNYSKSTNSNEKNVIKNSSFDEEYYKSTLATIKYLEDFQKETGKKVYYGDEDINFNNLENNEILVGGLILLDTGYNDYFEELDKDYFKVGIRTEYCPKVNSTEDMEIIQLEVYLNREQNKEIYENLKLGSFNGIVKLEDPEKLSDISGKDCIGIGIASEVIDIDKKTYNKVKTNTNNEMEIRNNYIAKNPEILDCIDVQYQMYENVGKTFVLAGEAEISDYYNYNYDDDINEQYASVTIGTYPYSWNLYFERDKYKEFLSKLEEGPMEVIIEAKTEKDRMKPTSTQGVPVKVITEIDEYK